MFKAPTVYHQPPFYLNPRSTSIFLVPQIRHFYDRLTCTVIVNLPTSSLISLSLSKIVTVGEGEAEGFFSRLPLRLNTPDEEPSC